MLNGIEPTCALWSQRWFGKPGSNPLSLELIPYVCFYNGLGMLAQAKKNPDIKVEAPKDLLSGFKKKRDFILSFKGGHHKSVEQCETELKRLFQPQ